MYSFLSGAWNYLIGGSMSCAPQTVVETNACDSEALERQPATEADATKTDAMIDEVAEARTKHICTCDAQNAERNTIETTPSDGMDLKLFHPSVLCTQDIVLFAGRRLSGKTTTAKRLLDKISYKFNNIYVACRDANSLTAWGKYNPRSTVDLNEVESVMDDMITKNNARDTQGLERMQFLVVLDDVPYHVDDSLKKLSLLVQKASDNGIALWMFSSFIKYPTTCHVNGVQVGDLIRTVFIHSHSSLADYDQVRANYLPNLSSFQIKHILTDNDCICAIGRSHEVYKLNADDLL